MDLTGLDTRTEPFGLRMRGFGATHPNGTWRIDNVTLVGLADDPEPQVVITAMRTRGPGGAFDEYVEIRNLGPGSADISGWTLQACAAGSGNPGNRVTVPGGTDSLPPGGYFLFVNPSQDQYSAGVAADLTYSTGIADGGASGARIVDGSGTMISGVGTTSTDPVSQCAEGGGWASSFPTSAPFDIVRVGDRADATQVTGVNADDFERIATTPRNSTFGIEEPEEPSVVITAMRTRGPGGAFDEYVEIRNLEDFPVDISGWTLQACAAGSGNPGNRVTVPGGTDSLPPGGYFLFVNPSQDQYSAGVAADLTYSTGIADGGASGARIVDGSGTMISGVGTTSTDPVSQCAEGGGWASSFPTSAPFDIVRVGDRADATQVTGVNADDFERIATTPRNSTFEPAPPQVVITAMRTRGPGEAADEYVEIRNLEDFPVDISGWTLQACAGTSGNPGNRVTVPAGTAAIPPGHYFLFTNSSATYSAGVPGDLTYSTGIVDAGAGGARIIDGSGTMMSGVGTTHPDSQCAEGGGWASSFPTSAPFDIVRVGDRDNATQVTGVNADDFENIATTPRNSTFDPFRVCPLPPEVSPISMVQGPGNVTPCFGEQVVIEGVVVGDYQGSVPALRGFYVQSRDDDWDDDPLTSEGIFVFNFDNRDVELGDLVRVTGFAAEFQDQTQLNFPESIEVLEKGWTVTITDVELPFPDPVDGVDYLERYEGMLVRFPQELFVTEFFQLGRFGQIVVSSGDRLRQPTNVVEPGTPANDLQAANNRNRLIIDDHLNNQNPDPILFGRGGNELTAQNTLRGGDTVTGAVGVMTYGWAGQAASPNAFRLRVVTDPALLDLPCDPEAEEDVESYCGALPGNFEDVVPMFEAVNERPTAAPDVGGSLAVSNFNVLNYFLTLDVVGSPTRSTACGPAGFPQGCRGANTELEFERQRVKLLEALVKLDSDIVGLIEVENSEGVKPLADIVDGLNDLLGEGTYDYVDTGTIGTDVIKVGFIYKPATVSLLGDFALLDSSVDPRFDDERSRPALAQTFVENATGEVFTAVVNHLKSKGCGGATGLDADQDDGQACWNPTRTLAAEAMVDWLATYPTGIVDDDILVMGDLNSYAMEDPISVFIDAGYVNMIEWFGGAAAYSFVFDGQWGYLDHALASPSLFAQVTGAAEYHINADEPSVLDYNTDFKSANHVEILFAPNEFRTSDHDPVVVGLELGFGATTVASPDLLWPPNHRYVEVTVSSSSNDTPLDVEIYHATSSEADSGLGPDDLPDDIVITSNSTVDLRAERFSTSGRLYTIAALVSAPEAFGLQSKVAFVTVPHNRGRGGDFRPF